MTAWSTWDSVGWKLDRIRQRIAVVDAVLRPLIVGAVVAVKLAEVRRDQLLAKSFWAGRSKCACAKCGKCTGGCRKAEVVCRKAEVVCRYENGAVHCRLGEGHYRHFGSQAELRGWAARNHVKIIPG